ncbi:MAG: WD40 repeat domain-containing protein [Verrucomicrobiota bacterium]
MKIKLFRIAIMGLLGSLISIQAANGAPDWNKSLGNSINWLSMSGDGNVIFTGTFAFTNWGNFTVASFNKSGTMLWQDNDFTNFYEGVNWTGISRDGQYAAAGGWVATATHQGFLRAYATGTGARLLDDRPPGRVEGIALSTNGTWLVSASEDLRLYQLRFLRFPILVWNSKIVPNIHVPWWNWLIPIWKTCIFYTPTSTNAPSGDTFHTVAMSGDGHWIVAGGSAGKVRLFENQSNTLVLTELWQTNASTYYAQFVDMTPDGNWFAVAYLDGHVEMFNRASFASTDKPVWDYTVNTTGKKVWSVHVATNGTEVAAASLELGGSGGGICMIQNKAGSGGTYTPNLLWNFPTIKGPNPGLGMDDNNQYVVGADGYNSAGHFYLLNAVTGAQIWDYATSTMNWPIAISGDGHSIAGGGDSGIVYHWQN